MRGLAGAALLLLVGCDRDPEQTGTDDTGDGQVSPCPWDEDDEAAAASELALGSQTEGYLCPRGDQDWYRVVLPSGTDLLEVGLSIDAPISPVQLTYTVWSGESVADSPGSEAASPDAPLQVVHGLGSGEYLVQVRDVGGDSEDVRHPYLISVDGRADPDGNEPNDEQALATDAGGDPITGYVSYRGDEDWYRIEAPVNGLVDVRLTAPVVGYEPGFRLLDAAGEALVTAVNEAGTREPTDLRWVQGLSEGGPFYVVVGDDDRVDHDDAEPYDLTLDVAADPDLNEPNDHPAEAAPLAETGCADGWSDWYEVEGWLATSGDVDWYLVELADCDVGLLQAQASFNEPDTLPEGLEPELRVVRAVAGESCEVDQDCQELSQACTRDLDCSGLGNTCLSTHRCAGAGVCLPTDTCGATLLTEVGGGASTELSIPLRGLDAVWVGVTDHRGDAWSIDHNYRVRTAVTADPDPFEPSETYTAGPPVSNYAGYHAGYASELEVHDCTLGDCCDEDDDFTTAWLGYAYDQDWFRYAHPCPGEDCMVAVHAQLDGGPVDLYVRTFTGGGVWYDNLFDAVEQVDHPARIEVFGGLGEDDECYYAWQGHTGAPYWYYLAVRDTVWVSVSEPTGGTWDWSTDQSYGLCIEKLADECVVPCELYEDGCGTP